MLSHTIYIVSSLDVTIVSCRRQATFHIGVSRYFTRAMPEFHVAVGNISLRKSLLLRLVGSSGLEPPTSCLSGTRSNLLSYEPMSFFYEAFSFHRRSCRLGGDEGNRTLDPLLAGQVLSQLSYTPVCLGYSCFQCRRQATYHIAVRRYITLPQGNISHDRKVVYHCATCCARGPSKLNNAELTLVCFSIQSFVRGYLHILTFSIERR